MGNYGVGMLGIGGNRKWNGEFMYCDMENRKEEKRKREEGDE